MLGVVYNLVKTLNYSKKIGWEKEKLVAYLGGEFGTSRRTGLEYVNTLLLNGKLVEDLDELMTAEYIDTHKNVVNSEFIKDVTDEADQILTANPIEE